MSDKAKRRRQARRRRWLRSRKGWYAWFRGTHGREPSFGEALKSAYPMPSPERLMRAMASPNPLWGLIPKRTTFDG